MGVWVQAESRVQEVFESMMSAGEESWHEEVATLTPTQLVEATFRRLFPDTFQYALPVWKHKVRAASPVMLAQLSLEMYIRQR
jgi:hypothetical protein